MGERFLQSRVTVCVVFKNKVSDVYLLSPTAKIDKKKVRWADESRQQAASEGNDKVNNNVCEPQE